MGADRRRGRPRDAAADRAALRETLARLDDVGYERLRVADVARTAGLGLGALYRRWPTKYALVVDALRSAAPSREPEPTGDPAEDLVAVLLGLADELAAHGALLAVLLTHPASEAAAAVREAKLRPVRDAARRRLRGMTGHIPDLEIRVDAGAALVVQHLLLHGAAPGRAYIREHVLPLMTGSPVAVPGSVPEVDR
ncbi:TetR/AcrR family transcriptional regulator [Actinomadura sp. WMMB 499]|uniref:TetR/AcrR family transcriptional regulator n=1 Tax=Actinomadura sp. WMMB 499 TaxID=1219491 RepID=UPI00159DA056|nr:TetR/AcrR family transcriptional regulator [Actinomadura sp. WMMB 499]